MKLLKLLVLVVCGVFLCSGSALALTMADVGALDTIYKMFNPANSGNQEKALIKELFDDEYYLKYDTDEGDWTKVEGDNDWYAMELKSEPDYFFIKIGTGGTDLNTHIVYSNLDEKSYAVISLSEWGGGNNPRINIGRVSHVGEIGGASVPEPSTVLLLGLSLVGLAGLSRKRMKV